MSRFLHLVLMAAIAASSALAQNIYRYVGPDGKVTYSDQPPSSGQHVNVPPAGGTGPGTIQQGAVPIAPNQPLPAAITPSGSAPSTIPSSTVPGPGSDSTSGRVVPGTVGPNSSDRQFGLSPNEQRIDRDAAQRNIMQGERAREAEAVRLNVEQGEAARERRDVQLNVPSGEAARDQRDMQIGVPADEQAREREAVRLNQ
jgi:Domain of unknown function (DUF4124)